MLRLFSFYTKPKGGADDRSWFFAITVRAEGRRVCGRDSSAIVHYLEAVTPEPELIPRLPRERARTIWFDEFGDTILAAAGTKIFFNRFIMPRFVGQGGDLAAADQAEREELPRAYESASGSASQTQLKEKRNSSPAWASVCGLPSKLNFGWFTVP